jgi:6-phospho-3-hexuloisomerase
MTDQGFQKASRTVLDEISRALGQVDPAQVAALEAAILSAQAVFVVGAGRSGLVGRCFAMRLAHLGLRCHVVGETVTPPVGPGGLLVALTRSGETPTTCAAAEVAAKAGAKVIVITAAANSPLARGAHAKVVIPTNTKADGVNSAQYGGSLFEQALLMMLDTIALRLQSRLAQTSPEMDARHANLE